jgi:hypothetical protein
MPLEQQVGRAVAELVGGLAIEVTDTKAIVAIPRGAGEEAGVAQGVKAAAKLVKDTLLRHEAEVFGHAGGADLIGALVGAARSTATRMRRSGGLTGESS